MPGIVLEQLTKDFPGSNGRRIRALNGVSVAVAEGELLAVVGPSGCGKTTVLRLVAGLEKPTSGTVLVDDRNPGEVSPRNRDIAMVFQHSALYPHMTAWDNIAFGLKVRRVPREEIEKRVLATAELLEITSCLARKPMDLSGGQRRRVAIGRALARRPKVLLMDEPLSNLDAQLRGQLRSEIRRIHDRLGATMIYVTHDQSEAMALGDRIAILNEGVLQQTCSPGEAYLQPTNTFVARFIGPRPMNLLPGSVVRMSDRLVFRVECRRRDSVPTRGGEGAESRADRMSQIFDLPIGGQAAGTLEGLTGKPMVIGIRPEHVLPADASRMKNSNSTAIVGSIESVEYAGAETVARLSVGGCSLTFRCVDDAGLKAGEEARVAFDLRHMHFFDAGTGARIC